MLTRIITFARILWLNISTVIWRIRSGVLSLRIRKAEKAH